jgi:hypothetical protein
MTDTEVEDQERPPADAAETVAEQEDGGVDPRIQERRDEVQAMHARRRRRMLIIVAVFLGLAGATFGALRSPLLAIRAVEVTGADHTPIDAVLAAGGLRKGTPESDVDPHGARLRIEALPWVLHAKVRRHWPRSVTVDLQERTAVASATAASGGWALIDTSGRVLGPLDAPPDTLAAPARRRAARRPARLEDGQGGSARPRRGVGATRRGAGADRADRHRPRWWRRTPAAATGERAARVARPTRRQTAHGFDDARSVRFAPSRRS